MSQVQVRRIVGFAGDSYRYGHQTYRSYEMMKFWSFATVAFNRGRVTAKYWDVDHD